MLRCNLGMALAKMGKPDQALVTLDAAIGLDPVNPLAKFERAGVLLSAERFQEALAELTALRVRPRTFTLIILKPLKSYQTLHVISNPLAKFERAGVTLSLKRFQEALAELTALRVRP